MTDLDRAALLAAYNSALRAAIPDPLPAGVSVERDGPLLRFVGFDHGGFLTYTDLGGSAGEALSALIERQRDYFAARGEPVEWKLHGHDQPTDLADRLRAAGFAPGEQESVVIGEVAALAEPPRLPVGVRLREVTERTDLERIARMEEAVWGETRGWLADGLEKEIAADPQSLTVVVAEAGGDAGTGADDGGVSVVSAGWVRYAAGTEFATLWGGSTLPQWRSQGIYRALVHHRARLAEQRGYRYLQVDASPESRPILLKLGFIEVTTTTPYVFTP